MNCRNVELVRQVSSSQNKPLTATSMIWSGVSLQVARCRTWVTPSIAFSTTSRCSIEPYTFWIRSCGAGVRLWHSARIVNESNSGSPSRCEMNVLPTLPVAPVTRITPEFGMEAPLALDPFALEVARFDHAVHEAHTQQSIP